MKVKDKQELHGKSKNELSKMLKDLKDDLAKYSMERAQGKLKNTSSLSNARQMIAIINTIIREKELIKNG